MKFENDYIRIEVEKKQLTPEQREAHRRKRRKRRPYAITAVVLAAALTGGILYGHFQAPQGPSGSETAAQGGTDAAGAGDNGQAAGGGTDAPDGGGGQTAGTDGQGSSQPEDGTYVTARQLAAAAKENYKDMPLYGYGYGQAIENLERSQPITVHLGFDPYATDEDQWSALCAIYENPDLTGEIVGSAYTWNEETGTLTIQPPNWGPANVSTSGLPADTAARYDHSQYLLFDRGSGMSWGNIGTLYLARYYDEQTGVRLEQPVVSIVTLKGELDDTPVLSYSILDDGRARLCWTAVEGAQEYIVCRLVYDEEEGFEHMMTPLGVTAETDWATAAAEFGRSALVNGEFCTYSVSEDDWQNPYAEELYGDAYEPGTVVGRRAEGIKEAVCVIAVSEGGTSMISNVIYYEELARNLPHAIARYTEEAEGFGGEPDSVEKFPAYDYVSMCDGHTSRKLIRYETENASVAPKRIWYTDEEGNYLEGKTQDCLSVPCIVEGTPFAYNVEIIGYDGSRLQEDMAFLEDREAQLGRKAGDKPVTSLRGSGIGQQGAHSEQQVRRIEDIRVFANSALGEYLAENMLAGVECIDLSAFEEARDLTLLDDVFMEAFYQNPLILGIDEYHIDRSGRLLYVTYADDAAVQAKKQRELKDKIGGIMEQIVQPGMGDAAIEIAINKYLCDTVEYDQDALYSAERNGYDAPDESFGDSFTAYGALINGRCVCSGYAAAFQLLAEAAGMESIVVTGILDGLPHAWNKVKLDGEWRVVDVTNNDAEYIANAILNLPDHAAERIYVEDRLYMTDSRLRDYAGNNENCEYYHITGRFFPEDEIAEALADALERDGSAALRTGYDLTDGQFYQITDEIYQRLEDGTDLYGYHWLGVIYLRKE